MDENAIRAKLQQMDLDMMDKYGWYAHYVPSGDGTPTGANYHTHGLERSYDHKNIQIILPLSFQTAHGLANTIIAEIKKGTKFEAGVDYDNIMANGYKVRFIDATECGRPVLRLLIPDKNHKFEGMYALQLEGLEHGDKDDPQID